jgi:hypothetical protein
VTNSFTELAEECGGEMVWQPTRPRRAHAETRASSSLSCSPRGAATRRSGKKPPMPSAGRSDRRPAASARPYHEAASFDPPRATSGNRAGRRARSVRAPLSVCMLTGLWATPASCLTTYLGARTLHSGGGGSTRTAASADVGQSASASRSHRRSDVSAPSRYRVRATGHPLPRGACRGPRDEHPPRA